MTYWHLCNVKVKKKTSRVPHCTVSLAFSTKIRCVSAVMMVWSLCWTNVVCWEKSPFFKVCVLFENRTFYFIKVWTLYSEALHPVVFLDLMDSDLAVWPRSPHSVLPSPCRTDMWAPPRAWTHSGSTALLSSEPPLCPTLRSHQGPSGR